LCAAGTATTVVILLDGIALNHIGRRLLIQTSSGDVVVTTLIFLADSKNSAVDKSGGED
jgi:hypothetical protein